MLVIIPDLIGKVALMSSLIHAALATGQNPGNWYSRPA